MQTRVTLAILDQNKQKNVNFKSSGRQKYKLARPHATVPVNQERFGYRYQVGGGEEGDKHLDLVIGL
jgi:hypothetical protein